MQHSCEREKKKGKRSVLRSAVEEEVLTLSFLLMDFFYSKLGVCMFITTKKVLIYVIHPDHNLSS